MLVNSLINFVGVRLLASCLMALLVALPVLGVNIENKGELQAYTNAPLSSGIYTVSNSYTLVGANAGDAGLVIAEDAVVCLDFVDGATLTVTGANGDKQIGAGAGILLEGTNSVLVVTGKGKLIATGANSVAGGDGADATSGYYDLAGLVYCGATGGAGGYGGGGAGAAIGSNGGKGGDAGSAGSAALYNEYIAEANTMGGDGGDGGDAATGIGKLAIYGSEITVQLTSGIKATGTAKNGKAAQDTSTNSVALYGSNGGIGGGAGVDAACYGSGGGGGYGGGGGHGGKIVDASKSKTVGTIEAGNSDSGYYGAVSTARKFYKWGSPSVTYSSGAVQSVDNSTEAPLVWTIKFEDSKSQLNSVPASTNVCYGCAYSNIGTYKSKKGKSVLNWHDKNGVIYFDKDGKPVFSRCTLLESITLYPSVDGDKGVKINNVLINTTESDNVSGDGWTYSEDDGILHLTQNITYDLTGTNLLGDISVSVETNCTVKANYLSLKGCSQKSPIGILPGCTLNLYSQTNNTISVTNTVEGVPAIYCPTGATLVISSVSPKFKLKESDYNTSVYTYVDIVNVQQFTIIGGTNAPAIGGSSVANAIAFNGKITFKDCDLKMSNAQNGGIIVGYCGQTKPKRLIGGLIEIDIGVGITMEDSSYIYPRPYDEEGFPVYYVSKKDDKKFYACLRMGSHSFYKTADSSDCDRSCTVNHKYVYIKGNN